MQDKDLSKPEKRFTLGHGILAATLVGFLAKTSGYLDLSWWVILAPILILAASIWQSMIISTIVDRAVGKALVVSHIQTLHDIQAAQEALDALYDDNGEEIAEEEKAP